MTSKTYEQIVAGHMKLDVDGAAKEMIRLRRWASLRHHLLEDHAHSVRSWSELLALACELGGCSEFDAIFHFTDMRSLTMFDWRRFAELAEASGDAGMIEKVASWHVYWQDAMACRTAETVEA